MSPGMSNLENSLPEFYELLSFDTLVEFNTRLNFAI